MQQGHWCFILFFSFSMLALLSACQPPVSGKSAGIQTPYLYWKLQQTEFAVTPLQIPVTPLQIPVKGVNFAQIQDTWGAARSEGRKHQGTDIFAVRGTAVIAATDGVVHKIGLDRLGGKVIWITGPALSQHYYAHLDDYAEHIHVGDWVEAGEVIGFVGTSGNAQNTPPHLHYGIYLRGHGAVNPYPYLLASSR